jgi:hypothetical protein
MGGILSYPETQPRDFSLVLGVVEFLDILDLLDLLICFVICFLEVL